MPTFTLHPPKHAMYARLEPQTGKLEIYRASAGSGKTYSLTMEYLKLLLAHPLKYREILTVTFTNKATSEMKLRILDTLRKLGLGEHTEYSEVLGTLLGSEQRVKEQADILYRNIVHDYGRFHVSTIDAFVQRIIRSFAYEIGLDAGYRIELNTQLVKETLAQRLYELLDEDPALQRWTLDLARQRLEEGKSWDFQQSVLQLADELFKERFLDFEQTTRRFPDPAAAFETFRRNLYARKATFETRLTDLSKQALDLLSNADLRPTDFAYGKGSFAAWFLKAGKGQFEKPGERFYKAAKIPETWLPAGASRELVHKVEGIRQPLGKLLKEVLDFLESEFAEYISGNTILQNIYQLNLMRVMARELGWYRDENNVLLISDTQALLRALVADNDAPFIYEKIGNRFNHFLIDEFQDTSVFQWGNFRPLIENALAQGHYNLLVGDVKQAIYRWRNGDWRLLLRQVQKDIPEPQSEVHALEENYRSTEIIIDFNNFLYYQAPKLLQEHFKNEFLDKVKPDLKARLLKEGFATTIVQAYQDSFQRKPKNCKKGGFLDIRFIPCTTSGERKHVLRQKADDELPPLIESLLRKGFQPGDIGILTRGNRQAQHILDILLEYQTLEDSLHYPVVSADALLIGSSWAVKLLLSMFQLLVNPKHVLAWAQLKHCLHLLKKVETTEAERFQGLDAETPNSYLPRPFSDLSIYCKGLPLGELTEYLIELFQLGTLQTQLPYLLAFRDAVAGFNRSGEQPLSDFLQWWEEEGQDSSLDLPENSSAVEILTIHKSKGLAYEVAIIPYADWELSETSSTPLWCDTTATCFSEISPLPLRAKKELTESLFAHEYMEERLFQFMDALNLMYVASTRARQGLVVFAPGPVLTDKKHPFKLIGDVLYQSLQSFEAPEAPGPFRDFSQDFQPDLHQLQINGPGREAQQTAGQSAQICHLDTYPTRQWKELLLSKSEFAWWTPEVEGTGAQRRFGQLMHLALSQLRSATGLKALLQRWQASGTLGADELEKFRERLSVILADPVLHPFFQSQEEVWIEQNILVPDGSLYRPDRVLRLPAETWLLDFKFTYEKKTVHQNQILRYKKLLEYMQFPDVKAFLYYGLKPELVAVSENPKA